MRVYDTDLIYSWTPREFKNFIKGSQLRKIDEYETAAISAMFTAKVKSKKRGIKLKDIYDAEKARNEILSTEKPKDNNFNLERYRKAKQAMKGYQPSMQKKGG